MGLSGATYVMALQGDAETWDKLVYHPQVPTHWWQSMLDSGRSC